MLLEKDILYVKRNNIICECFVCVCLNGLHVLINSSMCACLNGLHVLINSFTP